LNAVKADERHRDDSLWIWFDEEAGIFERADFAPQDVYKVLDLLFF
jgi:hypothetical protein